MSIEKVKIQFTNENPHKNKQTNKKLLKIHAIYVYYVHNNSTNVSRLFPLPEKATFTEYSFPGQIIKARDL